MNNTLFIYYEKSRLEKSLKFAKQLKDIQDYYAYELPRGEAPKAIFIKGYRMWLGFSDGTAGLIADIGADLKEAIYNEQNKARERAKRSVLISRLIDYPEALELFKDLTDEVEAYKERHAAKPEKLRAVSDRERIEVKINSKGSDLCANLKLYIEKESSIIKDEAKEEGVLLAPVKASDVFGYPGESTYPGEETYPGKTIKEEVVISGGSVYKKTPIIAPKICIPTLKGYENALRPGVNFLSKKNNDIAYIIPPQYQTSFSDDGRIIISAKDVKDAAKRLKVTNKNYDPAILALVYGALIERIISTYDEDNEASPYDYSVLERAYAINILECAKIYTNTGNPGTNTINSLVQKLEDYKELKGAIENIAAPGEYDVYAIISVDRLVTGGFVEVRSPYLAELIKRQLLESDKSAKAKLEDLKQTLKELEKIEKSAIIKELSSIISTAPPLTTDTSIREPFFTNKINKLNYKNTSGKGMLIQMIQIIERASGAYNANKTKLYTPQISAKLLFNSDISLRALKESGKEYRMQMQRAFKAALDYLYEQHLEDYFKDIELPDRDFIPRNERELNEITYTFANKGRYDKDKLEQETKRRINDKANKRISEDKEAEAIEKKYNANKH